jgi:hypothetical protein
MSHVKFYRLDESGFSPWQGQEIFIILKMSRWALGPPNPYWCSLPRRKVAAAKIRTLTPPIAEIKNEQTYSSTLPYALSHAQGQL